MPIQFTSWDQIGFHVVYSRQYCYFLQLSINQSVQSQMSFEFGPKWLTWLHLHLHSFNTSLCCHSWSGLLSFLVSICSPLIKIKSRHLYLHKPRGRRAGPRSPPEERNPLNKWTERMMDLCSFNLFFPHSLVFIFWSAYHVSALPRSSTAPSGLSCCCNVVAVYHWTSDANLCFALALCPLLVVVHILPPPFPSPPPSVLLHCLRLTCNDLFHAYFYIIILTSPLPFSPPLSLLFVTLVMSALACFGVTNHPLWNLRAKSKHTKTLHHDWLLATTHLALCLLLCVRHPWPVLPCPDWRLLLRALSVIGCADDERCSSPKYGLLADRYHFCEKCFNEIQGESVSLGDDPSQPQTWVHPPPAFM